MNEPILAENAFFRVAFRGRDGLLDSIYLKETDTNVNLNARYFAYGSRLENDEVRFVNRISLHFGINVDSIAVRISSCHQAQPRLMRVQVRL